MKRCLVIVKPDKGQSKTDVLREHLLKTDLTLDTAFFGDLLVKLGDGLPVVTFGETDVSSYDSFLFTFIEKQPFFFVQTALNNLGIKSLFHKSPYNYYSKLHQYCSFAAAGLPIIKTVFTNLESWEKYLDEVESYLGYPFVIKSAQAANGAGVYKVKNRREFLKVWREYVFQGQYMLAQELIPNEGDWRIVATSDKVWAAKERRASTGEWRNNASLGGSIELVPLINVEKGVKQLAKQSVACLGYSYGGVDIIKNTDTGQLFLLEVNFLPHFSEGTSDTVAQLLKDFSYGKAKG